MKTRPTQEQIKNLMTQAAQAGEYSLVHTCKKALEGSPAFLSAVAGELAERAAK